MQTSFKGKVVLITGASTGIGKALADTLLGVGARVAVCARNEAKLLAAFPVSDQLLAYAADVSSEQECQAFIEAVISKWGKIDILINNAGLSMRALFAELDLKVLKQLMDVNFWGTVYMTKHALPYIKSTAGSIVGVSSIAGYRGLPARTGYSASKFAMQGFMEALRTELLRDQVHVMWVAPGFTASNIRNTALGSNGVAQQETPLNENKLVPAETVARIILEGIVKKKRTIIMTAQGKATVFMNKWFGRWMDNMVFRHFSKEPGSPLRGNP